MKIFQFTIAVTVFISFSLPKIIIAEPNYLCYFVSSSGKIVDLTASLCSKEKNNRLPSHLSPTTITQKQQRLIEFYKRQAYKRRF